MTSTIKMPKRFDYSASREFNAALNAALNAAPSNNKIELDCMHMDFIDSAGLGLLVMAHKKAIGQGSGITIIHAKPSTKEILLLANLQKLITIQ